MPSQAVCADVFLAAIDCEYPYEDAWSALSSLSTLDVCGMVSSDAEFRVALVRDISGNPFRPVDFAPWRTDTAVALARQMYEAREFGAMPILADALQDAGC